MGENGFCGKTMGFLDKEVINLFGVFEIKGLIKEISRFRKKKRKEKKNSEIVFWLTCVVYMTLCTSFSFLFFSLFQNFEIFFSSFWSF